MFWLIFSWLLIQIKDSLLLLHKSIGLKDHPPHPASEKRRTQNNWSITSRHADMMCNIHPTFLSPWREGGLQKACWVFSPSCTPHSSDLLRPAGDEMGLHTALSPEERQHLWHDLSAAFLPSRSSTFLLSTRCCIKTFCSLFTQTQIRLTQSMQLLLTSGALPIENPYWNYICIRFQRCTNT